MEVIEKMGKDYKREKFRRFRNMVLIFLCFMILFIPAFIYFEIKTGSHLAFREAKNIKLAFDMLSVELYGSGTSIYDAHSQDGLREGIRERVLETTESKGDVRLLSYDKNKRTVESFIYETGHYRVCYELDEEKVAHWKVEYLFTVETYDGGR